MMVRARRALGWTSLTLAFALASCNGIATSVPAASGGARATSQAQFAPAVAPIPGIYTSPGKTEGLPNRFTPTEGDTAAGGHGQLVDKRISCLPSMGGGYHVHVFLAIVYRGQLVALPTAVGMVDPGPPDNGYVNTAKCFYEIHTHDSSNIVHLEVAKPHPLSDHLFKIKNVLDVWGVPHGERSFGPFKGKIRVYVGMPSTLGQQYVNQYYPFAGAHWTDIALRSHEVIWVEIGKPYFNAHQLPPVRFYMEY